MNSASKKLDEQQCALNELVSSVGGPGELLGLLSDYRQLTAALATAKDANSVLPHMRCWWGRKQKIRIAADLPNAARGVFLR